MREMRHFDKKKEHERQWHKGMQLGHAEIAVTVNSII